jgi:hypothetical protein
MGKLTLQPLYPPGEITHLFSHCIRYRVKPNVYPHSFKIIYLSKNFQLSAHYLLRQSFLCVYYSHRSIFIQMGWNLNNRQYILEEI